MPRTRLGAARLTARIAMVVGALMLVAAFFLPWASAGDEFRDAAALTPDVVFYEPTGMTVSGATDISLMEYAQVYGSMGGTWQVYMVIMYATVGVAAVTLVFAAFGKPVPTVVFGIAAFAASRLLVWDFGDRGVLPSSTHDWGLAPAVYIVGFVVVLAASVWMFMLRRQEDKRQEKGVSARPAGAPR